MYKQALSCFLRKGLSYISGEWDCGRLIGGRIPLAVDCGPLPGKLMEGQPESRKWTTDGELWIVDIFGPTGTGKNRYVMDQFGYRNVFRVTDYVHTSNSTATKGRR